MTVAYHKYIKVNIINKHCAEAKLYGNMKLWGNSYTKSEYKKTESLNTNVK